MFSSLLSSQRRKPDLCNTLFVTSNKAQIHYAKLPYPDMDSTLVMRHFALHCLYSSYLLAWVNVPHFLHPPLMDGYLL